MTTPAGRGRGYASRNRDLRMPSNLIIPNDVQQSGGAASIVNLPGKAITNSVGNAQSLPLNIDSKIADILPSTNINKMAQSSQNLTQSMPREGVNKQFQDCKGFEDVDSCDENLQSVLFIDDKYTNLIKQVNVLSSSDDGILTNQKLKHIEGVIAKECPHQQSLRGAMEAIASSAISDANTASKVSKMMCSSFSRVQIHQLRLYNIFVSALRDKIDGLELPLNGADQYLVNASTLLSGIYTGSKLLEIEELNTLAHLIIQVFFGLMECNTVLSLRTLNIQLMEYGRNLYAVLPEKLNELSLLARKLIIARQPPSFSCRIWLSLLSDQCLHRFQPLPQYLQDFYATHIDDSDSRNSKNTENFSIKDDLCAKGVSGLIITNRSHDSNQNFSKDYRKTIKSDSSDKWSTTSGSEKSTVKTLQYPNMLKDDVFDEKSLEDPAILEYCASDANDHVKENIHTHHERKPRPILGAGSKIFKSNNENQFIETSPPIQMFNHPYSGDNTVEISKICTSVPPPNFIPKSIIIDGKHSEASSGKGISAGQDTGNFWNYPTQKVPSTNYGKRSDAISLASTLMSSRLDLNSWRQLANIGNDKCKSEECIETYDKTTNEENVEVVSRQDKGDHIDDKSLNFESGQSLWNNKRPEDGENDKNWGRNSGNRQSDRSKKDWTKKEAEEKDSNWRRRGSEEKKQNTWSNKKFNDNVEHNSLESRMNKVRADSTSKNDDDPADSTTDKKLNNRRGSGRNSKRDFMEVPRKASYWTHDDRCDKDYNE